MKFIFNKNTVFFDIVKKVSKKWLMVTSLTLLIPCGAEVVEELLTTKITITSSKLLTTILRAYKVIPHWRGYFQTQSSETLHLLTNMQYRFYRFELFWFKMVMTLTVFRSGFLLSLHYTMALARLREELVIRHKIRENVTVVSSKWKRVKSISFPRMEKSTSNL